MTVACAVKAGMRCAAAALVTLATGSCVWDKPKPFEENVYPSDYKVQVAAQMRRQLTLRGVRDAYVAEPELKTFLPTPRFVVCVQFNSVGGSGAYRGDKLYAAYFYAGKITQVVEAGVEQCERPRFCRSRNWR